MMFYYLRPYILLRYALLPTIYTLAEEASRVGKPIIRPLSYEFPGDKSERTHSIRKLFQVKQNGCTNRKQISQIVNELNAIMSITVSK